MAAGINLSELKIFSNIKDFANDRPLSLAISALAARIISGTFTPFGQAVLHAMHCTHSFICFINTSDNSISLFRYAPQRATFPLALAGSLCITPKVGHTLLH